MMNQKKLLLVGWDAADWKVIDQLMAEGKMPALHAFLNNGVRGNIASLSPTLSPILWTSIATGKRAYDHGISGFVESLPAEDRVIPVRSTRRNCKAIWNILNEAGLKTNVVNWWPSHPAEIVNGVYVSNHFHQKPPPYGDKWPLASSVIHPEKYVKSLQELRVHPAELTLAHIAPFIPDAAGLNPEKDPVLKACLRILAHCSSIHNVTTWLMEHTEWDFMAVYQEAIDHFSHLAMQYHPPRLPQIDPADFERYKNVVNAAYQFHDMMLERLLELAGPSCDVMLISDHGFHSGKGRIEQLPDIPAAPALEHRRYGVFAASGPSFKKQAKVYGTSLLDITPTLLHHFSLPVAEDMEGQVQLELYTDHQEISTIPSWENTAMQPSFMDDDLDLDSAVLHQLQQIGYVDLPQTDKAEYVRRELLYNRNLSLLEGGRYKQLVEELVPEWQENAELRFGLVLAQAFQNLNDLDSWQNLLAEIGKAYPDNGVVYFQLGMLALAQNQGADAIHHFNQLESAGIRSAQLFNEIARAYLIQGNTPRAIEYFNKALEQDEESVIALSGKAQAILDTGEGGLASELLDKSLSLQFFQPQAHYLVAQIAHAQDDDSTAVKALEICLAQAPKHLAARRLWEKLNGRKPGETKPPVIVISGWPRSGTSMMMSLLKAGGLPLYTDQMRSADLHNPEGYFEHSAVLRIGQANNWIAEARGKAVKIVLPLLRYLPASETYKVIIMQRPLTEVVVSQEVMKGNKAEAVMKNFPFQTAVNLQKEEERLYRWLEKQAHLEVIYVKMERCISDPAAVIDELTTFLQRPIDAEKAVKVPNTRRKRIKLGEN